MGYECWQNYYLELMDFKRNPRWISRMPDGSEREIQHSGMIGTLWIRKVVHGRYMDVLAAADGGSSSSYYSDVIEEGSTGLATVRGRGNTFGGPCGVLFISNSINPAYGGSTTSTRLAFRGRIKWEDNVGEYKKLAL